MRLGGGGRIDRCGYYVLYVGAARLGGGVCWGARSGGCVVASLISMLCMARLCEEIGWSSVPQLEANGFVVNQFVAFCCLVCTYDVFGVLYIEFKKCYWIPVTDDG